jgi:aryl-alcohol dehydrogenase-like predicted oxidoreductase
METTQLGNTGVFVSTIGLGAMPMSIYDRPPESQSISVIHRALELGITFIDTADSYCQDESDKHHNERLIKQALTTYQKISSIENSVTAVNVKLSSAEMQKIDQATS